MRVFIISLVGLFFILQYALWFSSGGLLQIWQMKKAIAHITTQNSQLAQRNTQLEADVNDLKQGSEAVEERARNDLGMIKENETFYQVAR